MGSRNITEKDVTDAQEKWANGVINIGKHFLEKNDYVSYAELFLDELYAFNFEDVFFKPTLASEKQFRRIFSEAERQKGDTGENLVGLLERRLDSVVYRAKFVPTIFASRQFVNHGHILVNGKSVNIPSYRVSEGDEIELISKSKQIPLVIEAVALPERDVPDYLEVDHAKLKAKFVRVPSLDEIPYAVIMEPNLVVEFYAKN